MHIVMRGKEIYYYYWGGGEEAQVNVLELMKFNESESMIPGHYCNFQTSSESK